MPEIILELEGTCLISALVLNASDGFDKLPDFMVGDFETETCYQPDHLLEEILINLIDLQDPQEKLDERRRM